MPPSISCAFPFFRVSQPLSHPVSFQQARMEGRTQKKSPFFARRLPQTNTRTHTRTRVLQAAVNNNAASSPFFLAFFARVRVLLLLLLFLAGQMHKHFLHSAIRRADDGARPLVSANALPRIVLGENRGFGESTRSTHNAQRAMQRTVGIYMLWMGWTSTVEKNR